MGYAEPYPNMTPRLRQIVSLVLVALKSSFLNGSFILFLVDVVVVKGRNDGSGVS